MKNQNKKEETSIAKKRKQVYKFTKTKKLSWNQVRRLCKSQSESLKEDFDLVIGILRFGAPLANYIAEFLNKPVDYILLSGTHTNPKFIGEDFNFPKNKSILIVDDTCGTGFTLKKAKKFLGRKNKVSTLSLFYGEDGYKPDYGVAIKPDLYIEWPWQHRYDPLKPKHTHVKNRIKQEVKK